MCMSFFYFDRMLSILMDGIQEESVPSTSTVLLNNAVWNVLDYRMHFAMTLTPWSIEL